MLPSSKQMPSEMAFMFYSASLLLTGYILPIQIPNGDQSSSEWLEAGPLLIFKSTDPKAAHHVASFLY